MDYLIFEWNENKNRNNLAKHGISFDEAKTVFLDDNAVLFDDPDHSIGEERFLILGKTFQEKLCIVCHCYRDNDNTIRLISARRATKSETNAYYEFSGGGFYER